MAPAPPKRDRLMARAAAGIKQDGGAAEMPTACEIVEIPGAVSGDDADRADTAPAIRLASDPAELHRRFAFFEGDAAIRRTAQRGHQAKQCDVTGGCA